jgi:hypothetical protein
MNYDPDYSLKLHGRIKHMAQRGLKISLRDEVVVTLKDDAGEILHSGPVNEPDYNDENRRADLLMDFIAVGLNLYFHRIVSAISPPVTDLRQVNERTHFEWNSRSFSGEMVIYNGQLALKMTISDSDATLEGFRGYKQLPTSGELEATMRQLEKQLSFHSAFRESLQIGKFEYQNASGGGILIHPFVCHVHQQDVSFQVGETRDTALGLRLLGHIETFRQEWKARTLSSLESEECLDTDLHLI